ncbi:hypothetical protein RIF29_26281 [Crotalaria pallida]|uniref:Uncharacterized protein n=1 Tax=Crotalaria pallida TaxID=3830 RepID=A0AAN9I4R2_CROPI
MQKKKDVPNGAESDPSNDDDIDDKHEDEDDSDIDNEYFEQSGSGATTGGEIVAGIAAPTGATIAGPTPPATGTGGIVVTVVGNAPTARTNFEPIAAHAPTTATTTTTYVASNKIQQSQNAELGIRVFPKTEFAFWTMEKAIGEGAVKGLMFWLFILCFFSSNP